MLRLSLVRLVAVAAALAGVAPLAAQDARQESHTVRSGDTLWDLARRYLGDPFLWPAIYRLNTDVVEDPHWIYPGEVLRLAGDGAVSAVPAEDTPLPEAVADAAPPAAADADTLPRQGGDWRRFFMNRNSQMEHAISGYGDMEYRPLRRSEFYSSGFLTEGRDLPYGTVLGRVTPMQIPAHDVRETAQLFMRVYLAPPRGGAYTPGDSLLVVEEGAPVDGFGHMVLPTGLIRVTEVADGRVIGEVVTMYGDVAEGQRLLPVEGFTDGGTRQAMPVADGVAARVIATPREQPLLGPQDVIFLDKGRRDGVGRGDIFEVRQSDDRRADGVRPAPDVMAVVQVVHVGERSATARILTVSSPVIGRGSESRQIGRLPS